MRFADRLRRGSTVVAAVGLAVLLTGTFLPWLRSGRATRNSYEATGAVRRLVHPPGVVGALFRVWPLLGALCAVSVAVYLVGLRALGTALALATALAGGAAAISALEAPANAYASVIDTGPTATLVGAALVLVSALGRLATRERSDANGRS